MSPLLRSIFLAGALIMPAPLLFAADLQTDWIEPVQGYEEEALGAQVRLLEVSPVDGSTTVTIAIPKTRLENQDDIEEIIVYGRKADKSEPIIKIPHQWVSDYDNDYYGLVLQLGKEGTIPLRLYFKGQPAP